MSARKPLAKEYHQRTTLCTWNPNSCLKMWRPSGLTLRWMPYGRVRWGSRCKGFCSEEGSHYCFMQSARNMTINLIHELEISRGFHTRAVLRSLAELMSRKKVSVEGFCSKEGPHYCFEQSRRNPTINLWGFLHKISMLWLSICSQEGILYF